MFVAGRRGGGGGDSWCRRGVGGGGGNSGPNHVLVLRVVFSGRTRLIRRRIMILLVG